MASKSEIANRMLSKLGETRVSNIDTDNTKKAKTIRFMWNSLRDSFLQAYPWNFAIKRAQLAKDATAPSWGYSNRYSLPSDFLALLEIKGNPDYRREGGYILTDAGAPIYIRYIARITNTGEWPAIFNEAFATRGAYEACEEITQSNTKKQILAQELKEVIAEAYATDAIEDPPVELQDDTWLTARENAFDDIDYSTS